MDAGAPRQLIRRHHYSIRFIPLPMAFNDQVGVFGEHRSCRAVDMRVALSKNFGCWHSLSAYPEVFARVEDFRPPLVSCCVEPWVPLTPRARSARICELRCGIMRTRPRQCLQGAPGLGPWGVAISWHG